MPATKFAKEMAGTCYSLNDIFNRLAGLQKSQIDLQTQKMLNLYHLISRKRQVPHGGRGTKRRRVMSFASLGDYRLRTIKRVVMEFDGGLEVFAGTTSYDPTVRTLSSLDFVMTELNNKYLPANILLQDIPLFLYLSADVLLLDLNPRIPHVWLLLLLRGILGRKTVLWGHAWPRGGRSQKTELLRHWLRLLSPALVTYTRTQADQLRILYPNKLICAAPNALYFRNEISFDEGSRRFEAVYVGGLKPDKKPHLLIPAFNAIAETIPELALTIVGDGPEMDRVRQQREQSRFRSRISIMGYISDYERVREIYSRAFVSLSPGYVGLSITQSLAFGVPMIIAKDENHSPEIDAAVDGRNANFFESNSVVSLSEVIKEFWNHRNEWSGLGPEIAFDTAANYSVEAMAAGLIKAMQ